MSHDLSMWSCVLFVVAHDDTQSQPWVFGSCIMIMQRALYVQAPHKHHFGVLLTCVASLLDNTWTTHEIALMYPWMFIHGCGWHVVTWFIQHMANCAMNFYHWSVMLGGGLWVKAYNIWRMLSTSFKWLCAFWFACQEHHDVCGASWKRRIW